jgi:DNA-binding CsgD family transcriptional regulator
VALTRGIALINPSGSKSPLQPVRVELSDNGARGKTVHFYQARFDAEPQWSVRLAGIDSAWSAFSNRASYSYPVLPAGDYTLNWRNLSGQQGTVTWEIPARWYESKFAIVVYIASFILGLWILRVYYRRRLRHQARAAEIEKQRQLTAQRLQSRAAALEAEVELSRRKVALQEAEVQHRNRELARTTMTLARQNETLLQLKKALNPLSKSGEVGKAKRQSLRLIDAQLADESDWAFFEEHFDAVHAGFLKRLHDQFPELSPGDLRLAALLRMNLSSKEIAPLMHISVRGVENKRYRLRKKLDLPADTNLSAWMIDFE